MLIAAVQIDVAVRDADYIVTKDDYASRRCRPRAIEFFNEGAGEPVGEPVPRAAPPGMSSASSSTGPSAATSPSRVLSNTAPSNAPREAVTVILLDASSPTLDTTTGAVGVGLLASARKGAFDAMEKLPVKERIAIYQISPGGLKIVQDFTTDRELLRKSIKRLTPAVGDLHYV